MEYRHTPSRKAKASSDHNQHTGRPASHDNHCQHLGLSQIKCPDTKDIQ